MIRSERAALVDALATLPESDWERPSLCAGWSNRDVVGHMIATAKLTPPAFLGKIIGNGFSFPKMVRAEIARETDGKNASALVEAYRSRVDARTAPPGPSMSWLGETIVHGEDVFRGLGNYREHPAEHLVAVADFYAGSNALIGAKRRIDGLTLVATDTGWRHGSGPEVTGPMTALVLVMTGRSVALDDCTGDGVTALRARA